MFRVLLFLLLLYYVCNEDLLSKFHQNRYKIRDFRLEVDDYDKTALNKLEAVTFKYNRSVAAVNLTINFKETTGYKVEFITQFYKFSSNEYRKFPIRFQLSLRQAVEGNMGGAHAITECGNMQDVNFVKDTDYSFCNFVIDAKALPPLIPSGRYKATITIYHVEKYQGRIAVFIEIYVPIQYK